MVLRLVRGRVGSCQVFLCQSQAYAFYIYSQLIAGFFYQLFFRNLSAYAFAFECLVYTTLKACGFVIPLTENLPISFSFETTDSYRKLIPMLLATKALIDTKLLIETVR